MTKPVQVLDEQGALLDRVRSAPYEKMASQMISDIYAKSHMLGEKWASNALDAMTRHWREMAVPSLANAEAYHVSTEMLTLATWAAHLLPDDVALEHDMVPSESGFLMFEDAMVGQEVWGRKTYTHAILWRPLTSKYIQYAGGAGIEIYCFNSFNDTRDEITQKILRDMADRGIDPAQQIRLLGHLEIDHVMPVYYGAPQQPFVHTPEEYAEGWESHRLDEWVEGRTLVPDNENWVRTVIAIFTLMSQSVADTREIELDRHAAKRARRMNLPGRVTIIHLRRMEGSRLDHESDVEWQHRWVVRGHWRNQRYGEHLAETKRIWIAPHIKGPEDRPLVVSDKVYSLHR